MCGERGGLGVAWTSLTGFDQERPVDIATWRIVVKIAIVVFATTRDNETIKEQGRSGDFQSIHPTGMDFTRFNRHLLRSKLNWRVSHEESEIPSGIQS